MGWLLLVALAASGQGQASSGSLDVSTLKVSAPAVSNNNIDREAQNQKQNVIRLTLLDETVSQFTNQRPIPGLTFSWGPPNSGAIAFTDPDGRLVFFDRTQHKQTVAGVK